MKNLFKFLALFFCFQTSFSNGIETISYTPQPAVEHPVFYGKYLILGDSIAKGISQNAKNTPSINKKGITTKVFLSKLDDYNLQYETVIISLGSNDAFISYYEMYELRTRLYPYSKVIWIIPYQTKKARDLVDFVNYIGDSYFYLSNLPTKDSIHPTGLGYKKMTEELIQ